MHFRSDLLLRDDQNQQDLWLRFGCTLHELKSSCACSYDRSELEIGHWCRQNLPQSWNSTGSTQVPRRVVHADDFVFQLCDVSWPVPNYNEPFFPSWAKNFRVLCYGYGDDCDILVLLHVHRLWREYVTWRGSGLRYPCCLYALYHYLCSSGHCSDNSCAEAALDERNFKIA